MNKIKKLILISTISICLLAITQKNTIAQIRYSGKIEAGYVPYSARTIKVDPGPNWKGSALKEDQNGKEISVINGFKFKDRLFVGVGAGYLNYQGTKGYSIFGDIDFLVSKTKLSPLINFRAGHSKIINQEDKDNTSGTVEIAFGVNYKAANRFNIYLKAGAAFAHNASYTPIRIGLAL
jgi:hypothetical protein